MDNTKSARPETSGPAQTIVLVSVEPSEAMGSWIASIVGVSLASDQQLIVATGAPVPSALRTSWEARGVQFLSVPGASREELRSSAMAEARGHVITWRDERQVTDPRWMKPLLERRGRQPESPARAEARA